MINGGFLDTREALMTSAHMMRVVAQELAGPLITTQSRVCHLTDTVSIALNRCDGRAHSSYEFGLDTLFVDIVAGIQGRLADMHDVAYASQMGIGE